MAQAVQGKGIGFLCGLMFLISRMAAIRLDRCWAYGDHGSWMAVMILCICSIHNEKEPARYTCLPVCSTLGMLVHLNATWPCFRCFCWSFCLRRAGSCWNGETALSFFWSRSYLAFTTGKYSAGRHRGTQVADTFSLGIPFARAEPDRLCVRHQRRPEHIDLMVESSAK